MAPQTLLHRVEGPRILDVNGRVEKLAIELMPSLQKYRIITTIHIP